MSTFWLLLLFSCVGCVLSFTTSLFEDELKPYYLKNASYYFEIFIKENNRVYNESEKIKRFKIFKANLAEIIRMNMNSENHPFAITRFADLTLEEFQRSYTGLNNILRGDQFCSRILTDADIPNANAPESFDWRDFGVVTPVKNQGKCSSCFAFSAIGNIEGQYAKKYKQLQGFSEQQILDCDPVHGTCTGGGLMATAFKYLIQAGGSQVEQDYPYQDDQLQCRFNPNKVVAKVVDCVNYDLTSQEKLKQLLYQNGPISISMRSDGIRYLGRGKIVDRECSVGRLNHAVLLVGYGTDAASGVPYWIVKNSWGTRAWGDNGYFKMRRGEGALSCGMMNSAMSSAIIA